MPTKKPRVQVTLEPATHDVIDRFAELQGRSRGSLIAELLDSVAPALTRTVALLEAAQDAPQEVRDGLVKVFEGVEKQMSSARGLSEEQLDILDSALGRSKGANPHVVTRGSGPAAGTDSASGTTPKTSRKTKG